MEDNRNARFLVQVKMAFPSLCVIIEGYIRSFLRTGNVHQKQCFFPFLEIPVSHSQKRKEYCFQSELNCFLRPVYYFEWK